MTDKQKPVRIRGDIFWANTHTVNEMSGKYQFELGNLSDNAVKALEAMGVKARRNPEKAEKGAHVTYKSNHPIKIYDKNGNELTDVRLGNGSKAEVVTGVYEWTFKNKKGVSLTCMKLVVTDIVEYVGDGIEDPDADDSEGGSFGSDDDFDDAL